jgi:GDP/GTP exchange factor required for growth at low temperature
MCNFASLVAIIAGLQSEWVTKAMRRSWHRVGIFETRMFKDLRVFTSNTDDFMYIRQIVESIVDPKSTEVNSHATSIVSGDTGKSKATSERQAAPIACIPFIGKFILIPL